MAMTRVAKFEISRFFARFDVKFVVRCRSDSRTFKARFKLSSWGRQTSAAVKIVFCRAQDTWSPQRRMVPAQALCPGRNGPARYSLGYFVQATSDTVTPLRLTKRSARGTRTRGIGMAGGTGACSITGPGLPVLYC